MAIVALVAGLAACRDDPAAVSTTDDPRVAELAERRAGWEERRPDNYRFTVETQCFCLDTVSRPRTLTVEGDDVVSEEPPPGDDALAERIMTVDDLFDQAGRAVEEADDVQIDYDAEFDFPSTIAVDMVAEAIDDEVTYLVTSFEPVD